MLAGFHPFQEKDGQKNSSPVNITSSGMFSSSDSTQDTSCKSGTNVKKSQTRNMTYGNKAKSSSSTEESCRQLSYIIMQELATAERHNNAIHDKLIFNEQEMGSMAKEISCLKNKISVLEERINKQSEVNCCCSTTNCCKQLFQKCDKFQEKINAIERMAGIPLVLFANGIVVSDGPFRSYSDLNTQQFLQDILDGYFPSEFQNDYPDGVAFQVEDKRTLVHEIPKKWTAFSGKGYKLGHGNSGKTNISRLLRQDYPKLL